MIQKLCEDGCRKMLRKKGKEYRDNFIEIYDIMQAAPNLLAFSKLCNLRKNRYHFHPLDERDGGDYTGCFGIALKKRRDKERIVIKPCTELENSQEDVMNIEFVESVLIWALEDYH